MMEMQGAGHSNTRRLPPPTGGYAESPERRMGPGHFSPPPPELPKHLSRGPSREHIPEQMKNKIEVQIEIQMYADLHNCNMISTFPAFISNHPNLLESPKYLINDCKLIL